MLELLPTAVFKVQITMTLGRVVVVVVVVGIVEHV
jgi:hypothetical protein